MSTITGEFGTVIHFDALSSASANSEPGEVTPFILIPDDEQSLADLNDFIKKSPQLASDRRAIYTLYKPVDVEIAGQSFSYSIYRLALNNAVKPFGTEYNQLVSHLVANTDASKKTVIFFDYGDIPYSKVNWAGKQAVKMGMLADGIWAAFNPDGPMNKLLGNVFGRRTFIMVPAETANDLLVNDDKVARKQPYMRGEYAEAIASLSAQLDPSKQERDK